MNLRVVCLTALILLAAECSHPAPEPTPVAHHRHHHHAGALTSDADAAATDLDASLAPAAIASANPCTANRPPARLPDGGVNPEACIGACSLVQHTPAEVDAGAPSGTIDLAQVDRALRHDAISLRGCYESAVLAHPWLASQGGTVNVRFVIDTNGRVRGAPNATGIDQVPDLGLCLARRIRYVSFPQPDGGPAEVTLPFNFEPTG